MNGQVVAHNIQYLITGDLKHERENRKKKKKTTKSVTIRTIDTKEKHMRVSLVFLKGTKYFIIRLEKIQMIETIVQVDILVF